MRLAKLVAFNLAGALALLILLELVSRAIAPVDRPEPMITERMPEWSAARIYDRLLFWRLRAHATRDGERVTNSLGLRGPEIPAKPADEFRMLSLGESTTFAWGLPGDRNYSSLLEASIRTVGGKRVRVLNAGVSGYTLFQGVTYLRHRGLALEPDAVLVYFGFNDFLGVSYRAERDAANEPSAQGPEVERDR